MRRPTGPTRLGHIESLDGLRGLSVLLIMAQHATIPYVTGAFLGLELFFALSGFLITKLLLEERDRRGTIDLRRFLSRRLYRLGPAFAALAAIVVLFPAAFSPDRSRTDLIVPVVLQYGNFAQAFGDAASFGALQHTWSLALEEQFYLVWPATLLVLSRWGDRVIAVVAVAAAAMSSALLALTYEAGPAPSAYYRFDTRAGTILLGCAAAVAIHRGWLRPGRGLFAVGHLSVVAILLAVPTVSMNDHQAQVFTIGFASAGIASVAVVCMLVLHPQTRLASIFANRALVRVGVLSYALYLWHPVVFRITEDRLHGVHWLLTTSVGGAVALLCAIASGAVVERPMLRLRDRRQTSAPASTAGDSPTIALVTS